MSQFFRRQWFLLCLTSVLIVGFLFWRQLLGIADYQPFRDAILATVLFLMALPLDTRLMWNSIRYPGAAFLASLINMGFLPLLAYVAAMSLRGDLRAGVIIAATVPCTLASAAVWTRRAGGNDACAILVTVITNLSCFIITPFWLTMLLGQEHTIDAWPMVRKLGFLVVLPMVIAQLLRQLPQVAAFAKARKPAISSCAQIGILSMVLIGAVQCGSRLSNSAAQGIGLQIAWMIAVVLFLHLLTLYFSRFAARTCGINPQDEIAVAIAGSQKTLMVGISIATNYFGGLAILPMVAYHVGQLVLDTVIADRWRRKAEEKSNASN